jgi:pimeloyl-ACP methyl ester carboxylesterase
VGAVRGFGWLTDRLPEIAVLPLVVAGGRDSTRPPAALPRRCRADPRRRLEVVEEAHQPFQEVPDGWNARVDAFWRQIEMRD